MADTPSGGPGSPGKPPKEMSMEVRLLLAFILMGLVMFLSQYYFKGLYPTAPAKTATTEPAGAGAPSGPSGSTTPQPAETPAASTAPALPATRAEVRPNLVIDNGFYRVSFSNQGANVRAWQMKHFTGNDEKPLELANTSAPSEFPFSFQIPGNDALAHKLNWAWFSETSDPDGLGVTYLYSDGHTTARKSFHFHRNSYLSQISTEVTNDGAPVNHLIEWRGGFGDLTIANASGAGQSIYYDLAANKLVTQNVRSVKNGPISASGNYSFVGLSDNYLAAVFLPQHDGLMQATTFADTVPTPLEKQAAPFAGIALSEATGNDFELFVGPKDIELMKSINPKLEQVVYFGWMSVLAKPLFLVVNWVNDHLIYGFGWSIIVVTIAINFILFPLKLSNFKSMKKMQALKPQIDAINAKYKNLKITDPRKGEQNQEVMDLYKKYGVNPMGGCFPMLIQIPFFIAFYEVFTVAVQMRGAHWLWVTDLSQAEHITPHILPLIMIASQFFMQKITPQPNSDPSQQKMMQFMPLMFGFMFYNFASGLVLYYLTSNLVQMGQQWFFNHTHLAADAANSVAPPKKKDRK